MQQNEQNNSTVKQRILQFVNDLKISQREFYLKSGVSRGTLTNKTGISEETMAKIFAAFPTLDRNWVIYGKIAPNSAPNTAPISAPNQKDLTVQSDRPVYKNEESVNLVEEDGASSAYGIISRQMFQIMVQENSKLSAENALLKLENTQLKAENAQLQGKVEDLEGQIEKAV